MRINHLLLFFLLLTSLFFTSCRRAQKQNYIVIGSTIDIDSFNPYLSTSLFTQDLLDRVYLRLAIEQEDYRTFKPLLAKRWEWSKDSTQITFYLRNDVFWTDGVKTTAYDVEFSFKCATSPEVAWLNAEDITRNIEYVKALNETTLVVKYRYVYPYQLTDINDVWIVPKHIYEKIPFSEWRRNGYFDEKPVTNGPYKVARWERGQLIELVKNENYFDKSYPKIERVFVKIVPNEANLILQFLNGEIDVLPSIPPAVAEKYENSPDVKFIRYPFLAYEYIGWNQRNPIFADKKVRQALSYGINVDEIIKAILKGNAVRSTSPFPSIFWAHNEKLKPYPYDIEKARKLLHEAGWKDSDGDGILDKIINGKKVDFKFTLITNAENQTRKEIATAVQNDLAKLGIKMEIQVYEFNTFMRHILTKNFDAVISGWRVATKPDLTTVFHSEAIKSGHNFVSYSNPYFDRLNDSASVMNNLNNAKILWDKIQEIIYEDQPYTFLYEPVRISGISKRIKPETVKMNSISFLYNLHEWELK
ncbi:ABC transporter substrate-binding protein [Candidatus Chrysopegis kryptomonas]|uniref:Peptide/nickel transport system substrate-binding protein n=1 Tax=Candidatus Chryseopegocella kryptomonas TaxID=1633643 RepID=A0A0P1MU76_9BACT|nr:ABC transporter substrate-binding protein [Candidatus Chrysopegis kryptomonas]CUS99383.1 peptide/nickel transport system substrate-binding protein [Candidatus Chrysopegis kryptomonas]